MKVSKSVSSDNFPEKFPTKIPENTKIPFTKLFNKSLEQAKIPDSWRLGNITSIHKKKVPKAMKKIIVSLV